MARVMAPKGDEGRSLRNSGIATPEASVDSTSSTTPTKVRSRQSSNDIHDDDDEDESDDYDSIQASRPAVKRRKVSHVRVDGPVYPRSAFEGWKPPMHVTPERSALHDLTKAFEAHNCNDSLDSPDYMTFKLEEFSIYAPSSHSRHRLELTTLDKLQNRGTYNSLVFDGVISFGSERYLVQGVHFSIMTFENYGDLEDIDIAGRICIQSHVGQRSDAWYELGKPATEYIRFHRPFLWLATFGMHFINFLMEHREEKITLGHFRSAFSLWLQAEYANNPSFSAWLAECRNLTDFRSTVAAHVGYLWKEAYSIDDKEIKLCKHPVWEEVDPMRLKAVPEQKLVEQQTIVTPFVYECFRKMYFSCKLEERHIKDAAIAQAVRKRKAKFGLVPFDGLAVRKRAPLTPISNKSASPPDSFQPGDVVQMLPDEKTGWSSSSHVWYAYVQNVTPKPSPLQHEAILDVLWLYEPCQTTIAAVYYPFQNELFFSDNCNCGSSAIDSTRVLGKVPVKIVLHGKTHLSSKDLQPDSGFFVRQKFRTVFQDDFYDFSALKESDMRCACALDQPSIFDSCRSEYAIGDAVLVRQYDPEIEEDRLEPAQVIDYDEQKRRVILRKLAWRKLSDSTAAPNEVRLTSEVFDKPASKVIRKCHVRFYCDEDIQRGLPAPYCYDGAGDFFFINRDTTLRQGEDAEELSREFPLINEGWDPSAVSTQPQLKGLGMFCGGGSFDRGLEEGGAVNFRYAVDWDQPAIHSYRANADSDVHLFHGSVNDYLALAMQGKSGLKDTKVARVGNVDFISAGSPCPGFSNMQRDKYSHKSMQNASMVASVVSYVDFYSPQYLILENVITMTAPVGKRKDQNVFGQILAAFVGMGYQCQQFNMGAWSYGSSQQRQRVFIIASAPGLELLPTPAYSHDNPPRSTMRSLGTSALGLRFGSRRDDYTTFAHLTPNDTTKDLPIIGDAQVGIVPAFPDHRIAAEPDALTRSIIASVPTAPSGMTLSRAAHADLLSGRVLQKFEQLGDVRSAIESKSYSRIHGDGLFPTALTRAPAACARSGRVIHHDQHRILTVMENRRAQGFPDSEVIIGGVYQQLKIVGNSVDRKVAFGLGNVLRHSWMVNAASSDVQEPEVEDNVAVPRSPEIRLQSSLQTSDSNPSCLSPELRKELRGDARHAFRTITRDVLGEPHAVTKTSAAPSQRNDLYQTPQPAPSLAERMLTLFRG